MEWRRERLARLQVERFLCRTPFPADREWYRGWRLLDEHALLEAKQKGWQIDSKVDRSLPKLQGHRYRRTRRRPKFHRTMWPLGSQQIQASQGCDLQLGSLRW